MRSKKTSTKNKNFKAIKLSKKGFFFITLLLISLLCIELYYINQNTEDRKENKIETVSKNESTNTSKPDPKLPKEETKVVEPVKKQDKTPQETPGTEDKENLPAEETETETEKPENTAENRVITNNDSDNKQLEFPAIYSTDYLFHNIDGRFTVCYSSRDRQPYWAAYTLTKEDVSYKKAKRKDNFRVDLEVVNKGLNSAELSDYRGSSYDRGHLVPSADRDNSQAENNATFLLSNIAPQAKNLNRFIWNALENEVRKLAKEHETVYITTGGVLNYDTLAPVKFIGDSVTVPKQFYKVLLIKDRNKYHSIGYVMPNSNDCGKNYKEYAVTVDEVEKITGLDFFYSLDNKIEAETESYFDKNFWH